MYSGKDVPAVGVSIGVERVFTVLETKLRAQAQAANRSIRATKTQVLVGSFGKGMQVMSIYLQVVPCSTCVSMMMLFQHYGACHQLSFLPFGCAELRKLWQCSPLVATHTWRVHLREICKPRYTPVSSCFAGGKDEALCRVVGGRHQCGIRIQA
jgi:hypothetical protein